MKTIVPFALLAWSGLRCRSERFILGRGEEAGNKRNGFVSRAFGFKREWARAPFLRDAASCHLELTLRVGLARGGSQRDCCPRDRTRSSDLAPQARVRRVGGGRLARLRQDAAADGRDHRRRARGGRWDPGSLAARRKSCARLKPRRGLRRRHPRVNTWGPAAPRISGPSKRGGVLLEGRHGHSGSWSMCTRRQWIATRATRVRRVRRPRRRVAPAPAAMFRCLDMVEAATGR